MTARATATTTSKRPRESRLDKSSHSGEAKADFGAWPYIIGFARQAKDASGKRNFGYGLYVEGDTTTKYFDNLEACKEAMNRDAHTTSGKPARATDQNGFPRNSRNYPQSIADFPTTSQQPRRRPGTPTLERRRPMATVAPYAVLNCSVTQILGFYSTEEEAITAAEKFGQCSFAYKLSPKKITNMEAQEPGRKIMKTTVTVYRKNNYHLKLN